MKRSEYQYYIEDISFANTWDRLSNTKEHSLVVNYKLFPLHIFIDISFEDIVDGPIEND